MADSEEKRQGRKEGGIAERVCDRERKKSAPGTSRRDFIKRAAVGSIAVASTASMAKMVTSLAMERNPQEAYLGDVLPGDRVMMEREYAEMTEKEKEERVKMFINDYIKQV